MVSFGQAKEALSRAIDQARELSGNPSLSLQQQADAVALAGDLGPQLLALVDAHNRFMARFFLPTPPDQATVDAAMQNARALAQVLADHILAEGKLEAVIGLVSALNELATPPAAAGAAADAAAAPMPSRAQTMERTMASTTTHWLRRMRSR
ncbi:hypothetical protein [Ideonella azotifigens]|uniref:hypothetical protein n=1 Tax=Ideonella azotifigens TaxID=513160 RepID=UPI00114194B8|nr:hypothetical protein [Ideonella azotifigens]